MLLDTAFGEEKAFLTPRASVQMWCLSEWLRNPCSAPHKMEELQVLWAEEGTYHTCHTILRFDSKPREFKI